MGRLFSLIVSGILIVTALNLATFAAMYIKPATTISSSRAPLMHLYDITPTNTNRPSSFLYLSPNNESNIAMSSSYSAAVNRITSTTNLVTLVSTSDHEEVFTSTAYRSRYAITTYAMPSPRYSSDIQRTTTVTQSITIILDSESGAVPYNTKQTTCNASSIAGVVGGFVGGSIFGIVLTVLVTAAAAILITKWHKKGKISTVTQSRYNNYHASMIV